MSLCKALCTSSRARWFRSAASLSALAFFGPAGLLGVFGQASAPARNLSIHLDPASTEIHVTVKNPFRNVRATFPLKGGALAADPQSGLAQGQILVDATAATTGNSATDRRMQSEVLETSRYPAIFFHAEHLKGALPQHDGVAEVTTDGIFNIHGADHPLSLHLHVERHGSALTVTTHFTIPYVAWGMRNPSTMLNRYSKQAEVNVTAKGTVEAAKAAGAAPDMSLQE